MTNQVRGLGIGGLIVLLVLLVAALAALALVAGVPLGAVNWPLVLLVLVFFLALGGLL